MKKIFKIFFLLFFLNTFSNAEFVDSKGDFSSRSFIIQQLNSHDRLTQEQKDILRNRKLYLSSECLINQIEANNIENVEILLNSKLDPNKRYFTVSPLYVASKKNNFEMVKLLVEYGAKTDKSFESELYQALKHKNQKMAMFLIENGAKVNYTQEIGQKTILYLSLKNKMYEISKLLIEKGAMPDRKSVMYIKKHKLYDLIEDKN